MQTILIFFGKKMRSWNNGQSASHKVLMDLPGKIFLVLTHESLILARYLPDALQSFTSHPIHHSYP